MPVTASEPRPEADADVPDPVVVDWEAALELPAFRALVRSRRRFVVPAATAGCVSIVVWLVLVAYAPGLMATEVVDGVSLMLVTGLWQFVLVWGLTFGYLRRARRVWAPLQRRAVGELEAGLTGGAR